MKGRGRGRDVHAADSQHSMDAASAQPSRGGRQYAQDPAQQSPSSPEAAPSGSGWEDGFTAPARQAGRGLPGRGRTGRATVVTPAEIFAQAEDVHASATGSGRRSRSGAGSSQHRPTFYGREVSSDQIAGQQPAHQVGPGQGAVHPEAPAGSRRYLANRGDAGRGPGGPHADAAVAMAAAPSMVPVHHVDDDSQNVHFNPNAPGFLPMGGEGGEAVVMVPAGGAVHAVSSSAPPGRAPGASHLPLISSGLRDVSCGLPVEITGTVHGEEALLHLPHVAAGLERRADSQPQHAARYMSPATAKGVMLRHELQSMMATPQGPMPVAPVAAPGYIPNHQVFYTGQAPVRSRCPLACRPCSVKLHWDAVN